MVPCDRSAPRRRRAAIASNVGTLLLILSGEDCGVCCTLLGAVFDGSMVAVVTLKAELFAEELLSSMSESASDALLPSVLMLLPLLQLLPDECGVFIISSYEFCMPHSETSTSATSLTALIALAVRSPSGMATILLVMLECVACVCWPSGIRLFGARLEERRVRIDFVCDAIVHVALC